MSRLHGLRIHDVDSPDKLQSLLAGGGIQYLTHLRQSGQIQDVSVGVNNAAYCRTLMHAMPVLDSVLLANQWSLLDHPQLTQTVAFECAKRGVALHLAGVYASGILASRQGVAANRYFYSTDVPQHVRERVAGWQALCASYDLPLAAVALQFALSLAPVPCRDTCKVRCRHISSSAVIFIFLNRLWSAFAVPTRCMHACSGRA